MTRSQVEAAAGPHGLWFPVDPGADATLGGMAATNASGTTTVRYGGMRAHVLELEVVLACGRRDPHGLARGEDLGGLPPHRLVRRLRGHARRDHGADLRLHPIPEHIVVARAAFPSVEAACGAAAAIIGAGVRVTRCELLDATTIGALNAYKRHELSRVAVSVRRVRRHGGGVAADLVATRELAEDEGASAFESESDPTARARMWGARHNALNASLAQAPGTKAMTTDVAVPVSELAAAIGHARTALDESGLRGGIVGHVGDGNFHVAFLLDPDDAASIARAEALNAPLVEDALARGGTCTGEHGIGYGKIALPRARARRPAPAHARHQGAARPQRDHRIPAKCSAHPAERTRSAGGGMRPGGAIALGFRTCVCFGMLSVNVCAAACGGGFAVAARFICAVQRCALHPGPTLWLERARPRSRTRTGANAGALAPVERSGRRWSEHRHPRRRNLDQEHPALTAARRPCETVALASGRSSVTLGLSAKHSVRGSRREPVNV